MFEECRRKRGLKKSNKVSSPPEDVGGGNKNGLVGVKGGFERNWSFFVGGLKRVCSVT